MASLELEDLTYKAPALSSISEARKKIGFRVWAKLLKHLYALFHEAYGDELRWKGLSLYAIDASRTNLPREFVALKYKKPSPNAYYPQGMISALYDVEARLPVNVSLWRHFHERASAVEHLRILKPHSLVLYDRLYFARWLYELHIKMDIHGLFRLKRGLLKAFDAFIEGPSQDEIVSFFGVNEERFKIRLLKTKIKNETYSFATTLLDDKKYPAKEVIKLYRKRWTIEEGFKFIKQDLNLEKYHSKNPIGVKQELIINAILVFLTRMLEFSLPRLKNRKRCYQNHQKILLQTICDQVLPSQWKQGKVGEPLMQRIAKVNLKYQVSAPPNRSFERRNRSPRSKADRMRNKYKIPRKLQRGYVEQAFPP